MTVDKPRRVLNRAARRAQGRYRSHRRGFWRRTRRWATQEPLPWKPAVNAEIEGKA